MNKKQELGQFMTTNYKYIINSLNLNKDIPKNVIEPFVGHGDLLKWLPADINIECYDIDINNKDIKINNKIINVIQRDTIDNPPSYNNKFIITNPPYLARNKTTNKHLFDKYNENDLYKCFIRQIINDISLGGIIIIPLNFWSSIRNTDIELRRDFLEKYNIIQLNIFEENVFEDTTYTVCCFYFEKKIIHENYINITCYPSKKQIITSLNNKNNYTIGGSIYNLKVKNKYTISRLTTKNINNVGKTNIIAKCIDDNINSIIGLKLVSDEEIYIDDTPNQTARTYATLVINPPINKHTQKLLVRNFNKFLNQKREKYNSLFLTNYRESKDIARKRISFDLVYLIAEFILDKLDTKYPK
jgi:hypothetical protein